MVVCYLGLGSNLGPRKKNIRKAIEKINSLKNTEVLKSSRIRETLPVGGPAHQGRFLNAVLKIKTALPPLVLLKKLKQIEKELGRARTERFGPRVIDIDMLFYADAVITGRTLQVPHPRMFEREFVLKPLLEVL
jgi:2-amino-4-hydroxy-6-hydroxymethyldihydropteridine diphosphokinase